MENINFYQRLIDKTSSEAQISSEFFEFSGLNESEPFHTSISQNIKEFFFRRYLHACQFLVEKDQCCSNTDRIAHVYSVDVTVYYFTNAWLFLPSITPKRSRYEAAMDLLVLYRYQGLQSANTHQREAIADLKIIHRIIDEAITDHFLQTIDTAL